MFADKKHYVSAFIFIAAVVGGVLYFGSMQGGVVKSQEAVKEVAVSITPVKESEASLKSNVDKAVTTVTQNTNTIDAAKDGTAARKPMLVGADDEGVAPSASVYQPKAKTASVDLVDEAPVEKVAGTGLIIREVHIQSKRRAEPVIIQAEIADSRQTRMIGLMNRRLLPDNAGMWFVFDESKERAFWMRNTLIPLDIIYVTDDMIVHHIHKNAVPLDETPLPSKGAVKYVLEINGGFADKLDIQKGDLIRIEK